MNLYIVAEFPFALRVDGKTAYKNVDRCFLAAPRGALAEVIPLDGSPARCFMADPPFLRHRAGGPDKNSRALDLLDAVARGAANRLARVAGEGDSCFTGGGAKNRLLARLIEQKTGRRVITPEKAQFAGALGAAVMEAVR